jgi:predicted SnoaL-like aldol condensation-catalyzing enzyme
MTDQTEATRAVITAFKRLFYEEYRIREAFLRFVHPDYVQHNPGIPDGRDSAIAFLEPKFGSGAVALDVRRIIVDGPYAVLHIMPRPGGGEPTGAVADIYRVEDGLIVEHWDVLQPWPTESANQHPMF